MNNLRLIETFVEVAEHNSFVTASENLEISPSVVSRQISALEKHLGARLFNRTTRSVSLTNAGQEYYERVIHILSELKDAEALISEQALRPEGKLKISAPLSFGIARLGPVLAKFMDMYPGIKPEIELNDHISDLVNDRIDVAIRIASKLDEGLIVRKLCPVGFKVCASKKYIEQFGAPQIPQELSKHRILSYSYLSNNENWVFTDKDNLNINIALNSIVKSNNGDILADMAANGTGIVLQPDFIIKNYIEKGELIELLTDWKINEFNIYAVFLSRKFMPLKIRTFIDFLVKEFGSNTD